MNFKTTCPQCREPAQFEIADNEKSRALASRTLCDHCAGTYPRKKPEFPDDFTTIKDICPTHPKTSEPDWEELERALSESHEELKDHDFEMMGRGLLALLRWATDDTHRLDVVGKRAVALRWVIDSFGGLSARAIAKRFGIHYVTLGESTAEASRRFGIKNHAQAAHDWRTKIENQGRG